LKILLALVGGSLLGLTANRPERAKQPNAEWVTDISALMAMLRKTNPIDGHHSDSLIPNVTIAILAVCAIALSTQAQVKPLATTPGGGSVRKLRVSDPVINGELAAQGENVK